jgi:ribonuclease D
VPAVPLLEPREGVPDVVADQDGLTAAVVQLAAGTGPLAVDTERASGYRYSNRAYLVQLRRTGAGTVLIDPVGCPDLSAVATALGAEEWILHAAGQDLPALTELRMRPRTLFDTELAARIAGRSRVGLAALIEDLLGFTLEKHHAAADWSRRPLPAPWLRYAALDVELLVELRDVLHAELRRQGKLDWARAEFAALLTAPTPAKRPDPWRRVSGIHQVRGRRALATLRALYEVRDQLAQERDLAPGRVVRDRALVAAAGALPGDQDALAAVPGFDGPAVRADLPRFAAALRAAAILPDTDLPPAVPPRFGGAPTGRWAVREPAAASRLAVIRDALAGLAEKYQLPAMILLGPDLARRLAWQPPEPVTEATVAATLSGGGARDWQVWLTAGVLAAALRDAAPEEPVTAADAARQPTGRSRPGATPGRPMPHHSG